MTLPLPPSVVQDSLRAHMGLLARLYAPQHIAGKRGILGLVVRGETAHLGYGSSHSSTPTLPILTDLTSGRVYTVRTDGQPEPLPTLHAARREGFDQAVFRMRAEGIIPAVTARGVVYLDFDDLSGRSEVYLFTDGRAPQTVRMGNPGHNRHIVAAGEHVTAHNGRIDMPWPTLRGSVDGGETWHSVQPAASEPERPSSVAYTRLGVFRGRIFGWSPTLVNSPQPAVFTVERAGETLEARVLWEDPATYWPAGSSTTTIMNGQPIVMWPQMEEAYETQQGLYLRTIPANLFFTPDPATVRPVRVNPPANPVAYATRYGVLYAVSQTAVFRLDGTSWTNLGTLALPFAPSLAALSDAGALVVVGRQGTEDLAVASIPARAMAVYLNR
ncbi:MAG: hypothetical protein ACK41D_06915 [Rubricoccaceae bacterium]